MGKISLIYIFLGLLLVLSIVQPTFAAIKIVKEPEEFKSFNLHSDQGSFSSSISVNTSLVSGENVPVASAPSSAKDTNAQTLAQTSAAPQTLTTPKTEDSTSPSPTLLVFYSPKSMSVGENASPLPEPGVYPKSVSEDSLPVTLEQPLSLPNFAASGQFYNSDKMPKNESMGLFILAGSLIAIGGVILKPLVWERGEDQLNWTT